MSIRVPRALKESSEMTSLIATQVLGLGSNLPGQEPAATGRASWVFTLLISMS